MPTLEGGLDGLRGNFDGYSVYKMRGVDKVVVRKSSGHSKDKINKDPRLDIFRHSGLEFGGRALAAKYLMHALRFHQPLADYSIAGPLIALMKPVQALDGVSELGKRNVLLSQHAHYLNGFSLNRNNAFDNVIRYPVVAAIDRATRAATVKVPPLIPDINFHAPVKHPYYSIRLALGVVPDIVHKGDQYEPVHSAYDLACAVYVDSPWLLLPKGSEALELTIQHDQVPPDEHFTLVLSVGIRYGTLDAAGHIKQVP